VHEQSRAIQLRLDEDEMSATLLHQYTSPQQILSTSQGNAQLLSNGNVFVGWGSEPFVSEFSHDGGLLFDAGIPPDDDSYRAFRFPWKGQPAGSPDLAADRRSDDEVTLYASWNGATEVVSWQVLAGPHPDHLEPLGSVLRDGFETAISARTGEQYVAVRARDSSQRVLGTSSAVKPEISSR
jgi:hypothetical protein